MCGSYLLRIMFLGMAWNAVQVKALCCFVEINREQTLSFQGVYLWEII